MQKYVSGGNTNCDYVCILEAVDCKECQIVSVFEAKITRVNIIISNIKKAVAACSFMFKGKIGTNIRETMLLRYFGVRPCYRNQICTVEVIFVNPPPSWYKVSTDGVALGQPGRASCGGIIRMFGGFTVGTFAVPLSI